jgi:hypothetical protein
MWIPWCNKEDCARKNLFPQHHIALWDQPDTRKTPISCLWEDFAKDKSQVRCSTNGQWAHPGDLVSGDSDVGGDRSLVVGHTADGRYLLTILPYTVPLSSPSPVPLVMIGDGRSESYEADVADGQLAPIDFRVNGVHNVTRGTGPDPWTVTMTLSYANFSGPTVLPPNTTSHAFNGQPLTGHWDAVLSGANVDSGKARASVKIYVV